MAKESTAKDIRDETVEEVIDDSAPSRREALSILAPSELLALQGVEFEFEDGMNDSDSDLTGIDDAVLNEDTALDKLGKKGARDEVDDEEDADEDEEDEPDEKDDKGGKDDSKAGEEDSSDEDAADEDAGDEALSDQLVEPDDLPAEPTPLPVGDLETLQKELTDTTTALSELRRKHRQDELSEEEEDNYEERVEELADKRGDLRAEIQQAKTNSQYNDAQFQNYWGQIQRRFFADARFAPFNSKQILRNAVDAALPDVASKNPDKSMWWVLETVVRGVAKELDMALGTAEDDGKADDKGDGKPKPKAKAKAKPRKTAPKTLGNLPSGENHDDKGDGKQFAHLEDLEGLELESALAKLSPEQVDLYLQGR